MKKVLIVILICFVQNSFSQARNSKAKKIQVAKIDPDYRPNIIGETINEDNKVYNTAGLEVRPEFPGGQEALELFLKNNYKNPQKDLKGKVYTTFIIEKDGSLSDIKVLRDIGYGTGAEAIRVLKNSPKWIPGKQNDKTVRVLFSIPILVN